MASLPLTTTWARPDWAHYTIEADSLMTYQGLYHYLHEFRGYTIERNRLLEAAVSGDGDVDALFVLAIRMDQTFRLHYEGTISDRDFTMFFWKLGTYFNHFHQEVHPWSHVICNTEENYEWFPRQHMNILMTYPNLERHVPIRASIEAAPITDVEVQPVQVQPVHEGDIQPMSTETVHDEYTQPSSTENAHDTSLSFCMKETQGDRSNEFSIQAATAADATRFANNLSANEKGKISLQGEEDRKTIRLKGDIDMARLEKERENDEARHKGQLEIAKLNLMTAQVQSGQKPPAQAYMYRHDDPLQNFVSQAVQTPSRNKRPALGEMSTAKKKPKRTPTTKNMPSAGIHDFQPSDIKFDHFPDSCEIQDCLGSLCPQKCSIRKMGQHVRAERYETQVLVCGCQVQAAKSTGEKVGFCFRVRVVSVPTEGVHYVQASGKENFKYHVDIEGKQIKHVKTSSTGAKDMSV